MKKIAFDCDVSSRATCKQYWKHSMASQKLYWADGVLENESGGVRNGTHLVRLCQNQIDHADEYRWDNIRLVDKDLCPQCLEKHI